MHGSATSVRTGTQPLATVAEMMLETSNLTVNPGKTIIIIIITGGNGMYRTFLESTLADQYSHKQPPTLGSCVGWMTRERMRQLKKWTYGALSQSSEHRRSRLGRPRSIGGQASSSKYY